MSAVTPSLFRCILSKFYIKPQHLNWDSEIDVRCILSKFYIKPQLSAASPSAPSRCILSKFYIKPQQTYHGGRMRLGCILSKFYIKPQHVPFSLPLGPSCILSKFYIKPQLLASKVDNNRVVSYRNSTSNHNSGRGARRQRGVVSYRNSTSNHNVSERSTIRLSLYLIEILHQTTTVTSVPNFPECCILSKFYIKPQHLRQAKVMNEVVSYRNSTSNHNVGPHID